MCDIIRQCNCFDDNIYNSLHTHSNSDGKLNATNNIGTDTSRSPSAVPPYKPQINLLAPQNASPALSNGVPHR